MSITSRQASPSSSLEISNAGTTPLLGLLWRLAWATMILAGHEGIMDGAYYTACELLVELGYLDVVTINHRSGFPSSEALCFIYADYFGSAKNPLYAHCVQWTSVSRRACQRMRVDLEALRNRCVEDIFASEQGFARDQYNLERVRTLELLYEEDAEEQLTDW